jgi:hypothetical protein
MAHKCTVILYVALLLIGWFSLTITRLQPIRADPSAHQIVVTYREQEMVYYCGPAVVQMALSCLVAELPSQVQLATEMETDPVEGVTYTDMMHYPFSSRGFPRVYENVLSLEDLKENNAAGHLAIILIYFDVDRETQHYVLVVGYNASGILVHDPWPAAWGQPEGRACGENAFVSNELLAVLWDCEPSRWGLVIPYPEEPNMLVLLWQQHWYILPLVTAAIAGIVVVIYIRRRRAARLSSGMRVPGEVQLQAYWRGMREGSG